LVLYDATPHARPFCKTSAIAKNIFGIIGRESIYPLIMDSSEVVHHGGGFWPHEPSTRIEARQCAFGQPFIFSLPYFFSPFY